MKKLQKIILSALLFSFTFIVVHDYIIPDINKDVNYEMVYLDSDSSSLDTSSNLHESIHNLLFEPLKFAQVTSILDTYQKQIQQRDFFISHISSVLQRPPLS